MISSRCNACGINLLSFERACIDTGTCVDKYDTWNFRHVVLINGRRLCALM